MDLNKVTYFILTGGSKGIGKCISIELCKKLKAGSIVVLIARSETGLSQTKNDILTVNNEITVKTYSLNLTDATQDKYNEIIKESLNGKRINEFEHALIVHNVGSLGDVSQTAKHTGDINEWSEYYKLNVFSVACLNSTFIKTFPLTKKIIVNITSKCGIVPFKSMTFYCSGKSAREMYFRVLAEEEPDIIVLNYSPGPVDTDMSLEIQNKSVDDDLKAYFQNQRKNNEILTTHQTTAKFLQVLEEFKFKSGDHVDYFD